MLTTVLRCHMLLYAIPKNKHTCQSGTSFLVHAAIIISWLIWILNLSVLDFHAKHLQSSCMLLNTKTKKRWQHLPQRLRDPLAKYVGQHTLIITILSGVTDTHISIYINKWNRVWIQMMYHKVWMISDRNCTTNAGEHELIGDRQSKEQAL